MIRANDFQDQEHSRHSCRDQLVDQQNVGFSQKKGQTIVKVGLFPCQVRLDSNSSDRRASHSRIECQDAKLE